MVQDCTFGKRVWEESGGFLNSKQFSKNKTVKQNKTKTKQNCKKKTNNYWVATHTHIPWTAEIRAPPGTLVGDKNTTFGPVQDAINLFRYIYIVVYGIYICIMYINIWYIYT